MSALRKTALAIAILSVLALVEGVANGPEIWALKYDLLGQPVGFMKGTIAAVTYFLFLIFTNGVVLLVTKAFGADRSLAKVNLPNKSYWVRPENSAEALVRLNQLLNGVLVLINSVIFLAIAMARWSWLGTNVNIVVALILAFTIGFIFWTYRLFKPPTASE